MSDVVHRPLVCSFWDHCVVMNFQMECSDVSSVYFYISSEEEDEDEELDQPQPIVYVAGRASSQESPQDFLSHPVWPMYPKWMSKPAHFNWPWGQDHFPFLSRDQDMAIWSIWVTGCNHQFGHMSCHDSVGMLLILLSIPMFGGTYLPGISKS